MGITYTEVVADSSYNGWYDIRQARDISLKVAKPLLDAGWVIHLDAFNSSATSNYTASNNMYGLVLKSPDNLFSIGFSVYPTSSGFYYFTIFLYSYANIPSTVDEVSSKTYLRYTVHTLGSHPTNRSRIYTNAGLVELRDGGFLMYLSTSPFTITDGVDRACFGILPVLHCSSGATINNVFVDTIAYNVATNIIERSMIYYTDGEYKSEAITTTYSISYGGTDPNFEIIVPAISYKSNFISKSIYKGTRNNPNMIKGQTVLLDNKPYIVLYSDSEKTFLLAI